ncbi:oocyte zinc finger -like isoform X2 [Pelobates cultripes]|uniref:Oocyte zinc finger -like isoform X2 n=1 Tax=Pelobates cultripes TaxID=61616 RepID=A0AAD1T7D1_PELCU|nr:oocyte zinc finger -like isoform X2 [Pelobates cultripes]
MNITEVDGYDLLVSSEKYVTEDQKVAINQETQCAVMRKNQCKSEIPQTFCQEKNLFDNDYYIHEKFKQTETVYKHIIEEPAWCEEANQTDLDLYMQTKYPPTYIKEETASGEEGNISVTDIYTPTECTQTEYPYIPDMEESISLTGPTSQKINIQPSSYHELQDQGNSNSTSFTGFKVSSLSSELLNYKKVYKGKKINGKESGKPFISKANVVAHQCLNQYSHLPRSCKYQQGKESLSCNLCGKSFVKKQALHGHQRIHRREKQFSCSECGKCFGEKPFSCAECGKKFSRKAMLNNHEKTHTGVKPFSCIECGKSFYLMSRLKDHQRIHTRVK